jgi:hypothetical protein
MFADINESTFSLIMKQNCSGKHAFNENVGFTMQSFFVLHEKLPGTEGSFYKSRAFCRNKKLTKIMLFDSRFGEEQKKSNLRRFFR